jgi:selenocysteine lyase/cysteine desulfurase
MTFGSHLFLSVFLISSTQAISFGHGVLQLFALNNSYINLNHGSYGAVPRQVTQAAALWESTCELNPDAWFRYSARGHQNEVLSKLADYIGAKASDVVFIDNASEGVNTILKSIHVPQGKKLMFLNIAYGMVKSVMHYKSFYDANNTWVELIMVNVTMPATQASVLSSISDALDEYGSEVYLFSVSHIASLPAVVLPVKQIAALCHQHGVLLMVDGAHALGQISVNVTDIDADFWLGNGHKWLYSPKGSAILWARPDRQSLLVPTTISGWQGSFQDNFAETGTRSLSPYLAMGDALAFRESVGGDAAIMNYMHALAVEAGALLASMFHTDVLLQPDMMAAMVDVRVPTLNATLAGAMPTLLLERFNTWVPVYNLNGLGATADVFYVRVSLQIYNELEDVAYLGRSMLTLIKESE